MTPHSKASPRVLVILGTDVHPFDRLVTWMDEWAVTHPNTEVTVQHGTSRAPEHCRGVAFLDHASMNELMYDVDVVVSHGGPATISEARSAGHKPLVVPRQAMRGEHVDGHQEQFSRWSADKNLVCLCLDRMSLFEQLEETIAGTSDHTPVLDNNVAATALRFGRLVDSAAADQSSGGTDEPVVLYIAGFGRSGTTLLERLLGEMSGVASLGEVVHLWERGLLRDELCGCGDPFSQCEMWQQIGKVAFGGWQNVDPREVLNLRAKVDRQRSIAKTSVPYLTPRVRSMLADYTNYYAAIYEAAREIYGARIVVDSSKHASLAFALSHNPRVDLRVAHMVRDARAVAHSWSRDVRRPESRGVENTMVQYSAVQSSLWWLSINTFVEALRLRRVPLTLLRYETLVADPVRALARIWDELNLPGVPSVDVVNNSVELGMSHSVAGNPMRFSAGPTRLRADDAWRTQMDAGSRRMVSGLTWPLSWAYYRRKPH